MIGLPDPERLAALARIAAETRALSAMQPFPSAIEIDERGFAWGPYPGPGSFCTIRVRVDLGLTLGWGRIAARSDVVALTLFAGDPTTAEGFVTAVTPAALRAVAADLAAIADAAEAS